MTYYIFRVKDSAGQEYYIINNRYLGYVGFDSNFFRGILEHNAKVTCKYQLYSKGEISGDIKGHQLHTLFCESKRLDKKEALFYSKKHKLKLSSNKKWYENVFPNPKSSESKLCEVGKFEKWCQSFFTCRENP